MSFDLGGRSGLGIKLDTSRPELTFETGINSTAPGIRTLDEMREVLLDKEINSPRDLYYMYRDIHKISDSPLLKKNRLRYDVTMIKPDMLGQELMKTAGHYHPGSYGELYEVVNGKCFCMLQRPNTADHGIIEEVILVEAEAGEKIVIPPGFGHILINPGPEYLVTSNWVSSEFKSEYDLYKLAGGAAYFVVKSGGKIQFQPNAYFKKNATMKTAKPAREIAKFGLKAGKPIYPLITEDASKLAFLNQPTDFDYQDVFVK
jgi:glucose-6-phosphate isomerase